MDASGTAVHGTAAAAGGPIRVFGAEDEALIRMDLVESLRDLGYEVVGDAGDGETALRRIPLLDVDVALLDISMPVIDGLSVARELTRDRVCAVVVVTAYGQREVVADAVDAGALAYVIKPFAPTDLVPAIEVARRRFAEVVELHDEVADLNRRLSDRKVIDRAKAVLMRQFALTEEDAFRLLQRRAMDSRSSMAEVGRAVLAQQER